MRRLFRINIGVNCAVNSGPMHRTMRQTTKINYAVQRMSPHIYDWDTIQTSITPHESRARRLRRWQQSLRTRFQFRVVKMETQTTIIPLEEN
jgi:hypothetical protein